MSAVRPVVLLVLLACVPPVVANAPPTAAASVSPAEAVLALAKRPAK